MCCSWLVVAIGASAVLALTAAIFTVGLPAQLLGWIGQDAADPALQLVLVRAVAVVLLSIYVASWVDGLVNPYMRPGITTLHTRFLATVSLAIVFMISLLSVPAGHLAPALWAVPGIFGALAVYYLVARFCCSGDSPASRFALNEYRDDPI